jgi:hypothetical protein
MLVEAAAAVTVREIFWIVVLEGFHAPSPIKSNSSEWY